MKATDAYKKINNSPVKGIVLYYTEHILQTEGVFLGSVIANIQTGKTPPKANPEYYQQHDVNWFKPSDIGYQKHLTQAKEGFSNVAVTEKKATIYPKDTMLMIGIGGGIGRVSILKEKGSSNQQITGILFKENIYSDYAYYYYLVREDYIKSQAKSMSFPILNQAKMKKLKFKYPSKAEQVEFVKFIDSCWNSFLNNDIPDVSKFNIDSKLKAYALKQFKSVEIDNKVQKNIANSLTLASQLKQAIIQEAIKGGQTEIWRNNNQDSKLSENILQTISSEKEELLEKRKLRVNNKIPLDKILDLRYEIPKTWQWHLLSDVCFYQEGPGIRKHQYRESGIKILNVQNITQDKLRLDLTTRHITKDEYSEKYEHFTIEAGDILFASSGGSWGKTCFFEDPGYKVIMNTSTIRLKSFSEKALLNGYLYLFLKSNFFTQQMTPQLMGMQPNFGSTHLNSVSIPIPPIGEQKAIVEKVELLMQKCQTLEQEIKTSESHSQILMQAVLKEAFEGKKEEVEV